VASLLEQIGMTAARKEDYSQWVYAEKSALNYSPANYGAAA
jgi:hypothetical protein